MKTVGHDLIRSQLHANFKWYLGLGILLVIFALVLLMALPFATLTVVYIFGSLMMLGGLIHLIAALKLFQGTYRGLWILFAILYLIAGYYAFATPVGTAIVLTQLLAFLLVFAGVIRILNAILFRGLQGWGWTLWSGFLTFVVGIMILVSPDAPFWVLGLFLAIDILFQGVTYLTLASYIRYQLPPSSAKQ